MAASPNTPQIVHEGMMCFFNRDSITPPGGTLTTYGWVNLGTIEDRANKVDRGAEKIMDDSSGVGRAVTVVRNKYDQSYELTAPNVSLALKEIFLGSFPPTAPSPALPGGMFATVPITLYPGQPAKILDANGNSVYNVTAVTAINVSGGSLVVNKDWGATQQQLAAGFINILPGSTLVPLTTPGPVQGTISYTAGAVTGLVQYKPGSGPCEVRGQAQIHTVTCGQVQSVDVGYFSIDITDYMLSPEKASRFKPVMTRLWDPTGTYEDRFVLYKQ